MNHFENDIGIEYRVASYEDVYEPIYETSYNISFIFVDEEEVQESSDMYYDNDSGATIH